MDIPRMMYADADGFAQNTKPALVLMEIERKSIEALNISSTLEKLLIMTDSAQNVRLYKESLIISVTGYDHDPRELVEIEEVRKFFQKLTEEWPHWIWYLNREMGSMGLLLALLCRVKMRRNRAGFTTEFVDNNEVKAKLQDLLERGSALFVAYGISQEEASESAKSAMRGFI